MLTPAAIASELARYRHVDFVARADCYRLSHRVDHSLTASGWSVLRRSLQRWLHLGHIAPDAGEDGVIVGDRMPRGSHARTATR